MKREEKAVIDKISQMAILSNSDNDVQPVIHIRFEMNNYEVNIINDFIYETFTNPYFFSNTSHGQIPLWW